MIPARISTGQRDAIVATLARFEPAAIYLFGSFGTPAARPDSDIDLALLPPAPLPPDDTFAAAGMLADHLGRHVDLVDLTRASTVLAKEVLRTGIPIDVANPARRREFEMLTLADYARLNEERAATLAR